MAFPARNPRSFRWLVGPDMLRPCGPLTRSTTRLTWLPGLPWLKMAMPCPMRLRASILQGFGLGVIISMHIIIWRERFGGGAKARLAKARLAKARLAKARLVPSRCVPSRCVPSRCVPSRCVPSRCVPSRCVPSRCVWGETQPKALRCAL